MRLLSGLPKEMELKVRSVIAILAINFRLPINFAEAYLKDLDDLILKELSAKFFEKDSRNEVNVSLSNCLFFEYYTLWNYYALEDLKEIPKMKYVKSKTLGVQILNEGCTCNDKFGVENYYWGQLDRIPIIPRSLGCKCIYNGFREE